MIATAEGAGAARAIQKRAGYMGVFIWSYGRGCLCGGRVPSGTRPSPPLPPPKGGGCARLVRGLCLHVHTRRLRFKSFADYML